MGIWEAQTACSLHLAVVHSLHAGADDLSHIGTAVDAHGDNPGGKTRKIRDPGNIGKRKADHGQTVKNEHELHHQRCSADKLNVGHCEPAKGRNFTHAHTGHERAENRTE